MPDLCVDAIGNMIFYHDAEAFGLIVFVLESVFYFWYYSRQSSSSPKHD